LNLKGVREGSLRQNHVASWNIDGIARIALDPLGNLIHRMVMRRLAISTLRVNHEPTKSAKCQWL